MKKVLVVYYSQTGQLKDVLDNFILNLGDDEIKVDMRAIKPKKPYPFPWPFYTFFDEFPESVHMDGCEIEDIEDIEDDYDLIILGYTVWYMSPSIPMSAFLQSQEAKKIFKDKPVVSVVACRDMWILAQEKVKKILKDLGARHLDHVALTDQSGSVISLITLPTWMLTGKKRFFRSLPSSGITQKDIDKCARFGERLNSALKQNKEKQDEPMLRNLGAVNVNAKLIATEKIAHRSFLVWTKIIKFSGKKYSLGRKITITIYFVFLFLLLLSVVPLNVLAQKILNIFRKEKLKEMQKQYELPSGR